jgi:hypothetical protein
LVGGRVLMALKAKKLTLLLKGGTPRLFHELSKYTKMIGEAIIFDG